MVLTTLLTVLFGFGLVAPAFLVAMIYFLLCVVLRQRACQLAKLQHPRHHFGIIIPAHNEAVGLPRTLAAIEAADYPREFVTTLVVADHCTDETAAVARRYLVGCLERQNEPHRGKGRALAAGIPLLLPHVDAVLVLDADCEFDPDALAWLDQALHTTRFAALQGAVRPRDPESAPSGLTAAAGAEIENALAYGRTRLGCSVPLRGTGMVFRKAVLEAHPWDCFGLTEDRDYANVLRQAGLTIGFVPQARFANDAAPNLEALLVQRRRWRAGLFSGDWFRLIESKPLVLAHLFLSWVLWLVLAIGSFIPSSAVLVYFGLLGSATLATTWVYGQAIQRAGVRVRWLPAARVVSRLVFAALAGLLAPSTHPWERTPRLHEAKPLKS